ncbi:aldo/keto reductase [Enterocloster clostridioformis]|nr:aldo/keto reductase [Enterocloster clostridioformis]
MMMNMITLNNDIQMPMLGFGTFLMGGAECEESVLTALRNGYRMIDTAEAYGNEEAVGNAVQKSGIPRKELFLVTKVNFRSYENARATVEASLKKLKTSYLDLVLLHWPFGNYYAAWRELEKLYQDRKIRAIGVSNFDPDRLIDLIEFNKVTPAVNQIETHLLCQRMSEHEWLEKYHVQHMAYAPLGQGRKNEMFENPVLIEIAKVHGKTAAQIALRFLMQSGVVVIPKSIHEERIKENFDMFDFELNMDEMEQLRKMDTAVPMIGNPENPAMLEAAMKW